MPRVSRDITDDSHQDDRWVTFDQLAEARKISRASAIRLVRRRKQWRRQKDNRGHVTVLVPAWELQPSPDSPPASHPAITDDNHPDAPGVITALQNAFDAALAAKDETISELRAALYNALAAGATTTEALRQAERREADLKGQGRWARLRLAWRGF